MTIICTEVVGMQVKPTHQANTRRGAKYIHKEYSELDISSPEELQELVEKVAQKVPRSKKYDAAMRNWCTKSVEAIRYHLSQNLPHPADPEAFGELFFNLGTAADRGEMPSFACPKARAGYAIEFMCRARLITDLFLNKYIEPASEDAYASKFCNNRNSDEIIDKTCRILSLGGGPGYDYLGVLLADTFGTAGLGKTRIEGIVFDYEEGWQDLVEAMNTATQLALVNDNKSFVKWGGGCDITKPLSDPSNAACKSEVASSDLIICQYCVAENAKRLRDSEFCFFADLFEKAADNTTIVVTEVTPRIWPEITDVILQRPDGGKGFSIDFLRAIKRQLGPQLVVQKREGNTISTAELAACEEFRRLQELHERKIQNGFTRQPKKVRGSKISEEKLASA